jgi:hypothetical protein
VGNPVAGPNPSVEFPGLENKKVVVVCRSLARLPYHDAGTPREVALAVGRLLARYDPRIKVVDQQKVSAWTDEHAWGQFPEVGRALGAEVVLGIDLTGFELVAGTSLYRGRAALEVKVFDLSKAEGQEVVFARSLPQVAYPAGAAIPFSDSSEPEFRHRFVLVLADQVARPFFAPRQFSDINLDARTRPGTVL